MIASIFREDNNLTAGQMAARAAVVFVITLVLIRVSGRRSFGQRTPFGAATTVLLGAVLSRGGVGASPFGATVAAAAVLVLLHRVLGWLSVRWDGFDVLVNGRERVVLSDGRKHEKALSGVDYAARSCRGGPQEARPCRLERRGQRGAFPEIWKLRTDL